MIPVAYYLLRPECDYENWPQPKYVCESSDHDFHEVISHTRPGDCVWIKLASDPSLIQDLALSGRKVIAGVSPNDIGRFKDVLNKEAHHYGIDTLEEAHDFE
jgi:hypothetical protein